MTMITPSYLGETIEYSSLHACRSTLEDPTSATRTGVLSVAGYSIQVTEGAKGNLELGKPVKLTEAVH